MQGYGGGQRHRGTHTSVIHHSDVHTHIYLQFNILPSLVTKLVKCVIVKMHGCFLEAEASIEIDTIIGLSVDFLAMRKQLCILIISYVACV
jgi:hypothetical protein